MVLRYEYLIQWLDTEPDLGPEYETIIRPNSVTSTFDVKHGAYSLTLAEGKFSFSWEPPGLQVVFHAKDLSKPPPRDTVTHWVQEICDNIVLASGLPAKVLIEDGDVWSF